MENKKIIEFNPPVSINVKTIPEQYIKISDDSKFGELTRIDDENLINQIKTEIEKIKESADKIPFHLDQVINEDKLGREPIAKAFVSLIKNDIFTGELNHSFMVHLQGDWGSGKSSFLNFIKKHLNEGNEQWVVVEYNAWQNQHIQPPWWTLIDQIYHKSIVSLHWRNRFCFYLLEKWRRFVAYSDLRKIIAFGITIFFLALLFIFSQPIIEYLINILSNLGCKTPEDIDLENTLLSISSIIGIVYSFSKLITTPFFIKSSDEASTFVIQAEDPMNKIKKHFSGLVNNINKPGKRQLAIFIDDIDRCNKEFIVQLLEGIQTLFKEKRVLYIVAGEKRWITTSFGKIYEEFAIENEKCSQLGELFLEKAFQLSIRMPNVDNDAKQKYWNYLIGNGVEKSTENKVTSVDKLTEENKQLFNKRIEEITKSDKDIAHPEIMREIQNEFNLTSDAVSDSIIQEKNKDKKEIHHLLAEFYDVINDNPRSIIRLTNNYTMTRSILIAERKYISPDKIFRWLVLEDLYPSIKNEIIKFTELEQVENYLGKIKNQPLKENCQALINGNPDKNQEPLLFEDILCVSGL